MTTISQERTRLTNVGMRHRRREQWGAVHNYAQARAVTEPATRVFIHITVTNPGNYNSFDAHARAIEAIGRARFGTSSSNTGISYNRLFMAGTRAIYEAQPIGRRGAHTVNDFKRSTCSTSGCPGRGSSLTAPSWNLNVVARAYAICQNVGQSVPDHMVEDIARAIVADHRAGFLTRTAVTNIHGHRCVSSKSCPGDRMWARMAAVQSRVNALLSGTTPPPPPPPPPEDDMPAPRDFTAADWAAMRRNLFGDDKHIGNRIVRNTDKNEDWHLRVGMLRLERATDPVPPNAWMSERWSDIPEGGYRPEIYGRAAYGHARRAAEGIEVTVTPLLEQLVAAQGGAHRDEVLADIQSKLHQAQQERLAIANRLDEQSAALVDVRAVLEEYQSGVLDPQELADALIRRFQLPADEES